MEKYDVVKLKVAISFDSNKLIANIKRDFPDWENRDMDVVCEYDVFTVYYSEDLGIDYKTYPLEDYIVVKQIMIKLTQKGIDKVQGLVDRLGEAYCNYHYEAELRDWIKGLEKHVTKNAPSVAINIQNEYVYTGSIPLPKRAYCDYYFINFEFPEDFVLVITE